MKSAKLWLLPAFLLVTGVPVFAQTVTWTGAVSTAWATPGNWSPAHVPVATEDVVIPGPSQALHNPNVSTSVVAQNVTLGSGAVLYLDATGTLNVYGNFTNQAGTVSGIGRGTVALVGNSVQQLIGPASTSFRNLSVGAAGAVVAGPVAIERGLVVKGNLTVSSGQSFTLLSTPTGPGYVVNAGGVVVGTVTVQRYIDPSINPGYGYRHLSSPVDNVTFTTLQGPGYTPVFNPAYNSSQNPQTTVPYPTVYGYDQSRLTTQANATVSDFDKGFYSPAATDRMVPGVGYTVNLPGAANGISGPGTVVSYTGNLTNGSVTAAVARGPQAGAGWQLLGNPYPSPLNWDGVFANPGTTGIQSALYVYKSTGQYVGNYSSYVNGVGTNGGTKVLPLGQAYFVMASGPGQVAYSNSARMSSDSTLLQRTAATPLIGAKLLLSSAASRTETAVYFDANATAGLDAAYDAVALPAGAMRLSSLAAGQDLAINGLPLLGSQDVTVPLTLTVSNAGNYLLSRTDGSLPTGYKVYLLDAQLGTSTDLTGSAAYPLTLAAGTVPVGRFSLLFTKTTTPLATAPAAELAGTVVYPNPATGSVTVLLPQVARTGTASAEIINALGQTVVRRSLTAAATQQLPLDACAPGVYTVRLTTPAGPVSKRLVIQ